MSGNGHDRPGDDCPGSEQMQAGPRGFVPAPDWVNDLIIYELSTRNFTSPNGPESGTFTSLREKLPYLNDLGITGIWLSGHNWADNSHFYNIWTQYAVIRPDVIDEKLGTEDEFKQLIEAAHDYGIKVFLDVITHGVMNDSPLTKEHPEWFKQGTWGMTDYDWYGDHEDLFSWWVDTWVRYVTEFGVDGYRLDVSMYRPDLWQEIRGRCREAGRPIIVFHELGPEKRGVLDFLQWDLRLKFNTQILNKEQPLIMRMPRSVEEKIENELGEYMVVVECKDGTFLSTPIIEMGDSPFGLHCGEYADKIDPSLIVDSVMREESDIQNPRTGEGYGEDRIIITVTGLPSSPEVAAKSSGTASFIENITVFNPEGYMWRLHGTIGEDYKLTYRWENDELELYFPPRYTAGSFLSIQLSCHDDGWVGFDPKSNPYVAQGSRFIFGYSFLFVPAVPIFMSGEEFDADFVPNPRLSPDLYGKETAGTGTWLYGSRLQWQQIEDTRHREMFEDVKKLIAIRKEYAHLIHPARREQPLDTFFSVESYSPETLPQPYLYCNRDTMLIIAGNPSTENDVHCSLALPWENLPLERKDRYSVRSLLHELPARSMSMKELKQFRCDIPRDNRQGGGVAVWEISLSP